MSKVRFIRCALMMLCFVWLSGIMATFAIAAVHAPSVPTLPPGTLKHYVGAAIRTGENNGYSGNRTIEVNDPHFGWTLGRFFVSGYTRVTENASANPVFLKTLGDTVTLWFTLEQDINALNGNDALSIGENTSGYDEYFGVSKTNFGHGTLIIRHTDYQNSKSEPTIYTDYLAANATMGADTTVELFEEGDYEVALNYEIKKNEFWFIDTFYHYRIFFKFSVRNGNCMVYPFDAATKTELANNAATENGFYLDLAKSRYLDIDIKKEVLVAGANGLTEDTRFNRPAKDGDEYTEEGIYIISVSNRYTGQQTDKLIYVGTNNILKTFVETGLSIDEINEQLASGDYTTADGVIPTLTQLANTTLAAEQTAIDSPEQHAYSAAGNESTSPPSRPQIWALIICFLLIALIGGIVILFVRHRGLTKTNKTNRTEDENPGICAKCEDEIK